ncbi:MAG TPA: hypothetical protein VHV55_26095 [Pirellulales bacterium]|jgi:hypothetical protein|nr:hypothetical protein [Pirellulales bacterium]
MLTSMVGGPLLEIGRIPTMPPARQAKELPWMRRFRDQSSTFRQIVEHVLGILYSARKLSNIRTAARLTKRSTARQQDILAHVGRFSPF